MISNELQVALHDSFFRARGKCHKWITVEHLLLELVGLPSIQDRLRSSGVDANALRADLESCVSQTETFPSTQMGDTEPTAAFRKAIEDAILMIQEKGQTELSSIDVLDTVALHSEGLALNPAVQRRIASFR